MNPRFHIDVERTRCAPGDSVRGTVTVGTGGSSRRLEVCLQYVEETARYSACALELAPTVLHTGDLEAGTSFEFELDIPADAPPNFRSSHGSLYWQIDAKSDEVGSDTHDRCRIEVAPPSQEAG